MSKRALSVAGVRSQDVALLLATLFLFLVSTQAHGRQEEPAVIIEWPNEGETFYAGAPSLLYNIPVRGHIVNSPEGVTPITVGLELWQDNVLIGRYTQEAVDNTFSFYATVNPHGSAGQFPAEHADCGAICHRPGNFVLPSGPVRLRLSIVNPPNLQHRPSERHIVVDRSSSAIIPVDVRLADEPTRFVAGVTVSGATRLYLYRGRHFLATSDAEGNAALAVEALGQAPTDYVVRVDPTVVDGLLYQGEGEAIVHLAPGVDTAEPVTLFVRAYPGQISGRVSSYSASGNGGTPDTVRAIALPDGQVYETPISATGEFSFKSLPIDQYRVTLHGRQGQATIWQDVNLTASHEEEVRLPLVDASGPLLTGQVVDNTGQPLPFAWISVGEEATVVRRCDGYFQARGGGEGTARLLVQAPGFYSRIEVAEPDGEPKPITLVPQPDTRHVRLQDGYVWIAAESEAEIAKQSIHLERGWLWGQAHGTRLRIETDQVKVVMDDASFALEQVPGNHGWLYVWEGTAEVSPLAAADSVTVSANQMVNLFNSEGLKAVDYDPEVLRTLNVGAEGTLPVVWQPTAAAKVRDGLARLGIGMAQIVTFITYFLVVLSLGIVPLAGIYSVYRRRQRGAE